MGINVGSSRKMGMSNRNDMYDIRSDALQMEKMKSRQVADIDNLLNEDIDIPYDDGRPSVAEHDDPFD